MARGLRRGLRQGLCGFALILLSVYLVRAFDSLRLRPLESWHRLTPGAEFRAGDGDDWGAYLEREGRLFEGVRAKLSSEAAARDGTRRLSRYFPGGPNDPAADPFGLGADWNRSYELVAEGEARGAVLLVHGLSDSPYSLRSFAELFAAEGYHVVGLRLPGHGTVPGALSRVSWEDWAAAVELAARRAEVLAQSASGSAGGDLVLVGYSAGGALVTRLAARAVLDDGLPRADRLVLLSPAIGITPLARAGRWHRYLSWTPWFERFAWQAVEPEYDPYKYNSFPKRAGAEMHALAARTCDALAKLEGAGRLDELPAVLAFQSLADATVSTAAVLEELFARLEAPGTELVLFDVNEQAALTPFLRVPDRGAFERVRDDRERRFRLTLVANRGDDGGAVAALTYAPGEVAPRTEPLGAEWPLEVYSLSHVAMPFRGDDPHYGHVETGAEAWRLGAVAPRGERGVLAVALEDLMRLRHNPFWDYVAARVRAQLPQSSEPDD